MKKIFLFGYYGYHNTGDEAILETIIKQLRSISSDFKMKVLTYKAEETARKHQVETVSRNQLFELLKAIKESDVVVSGGGSILQDVTSSRSLLYYLAIIWIAKKLGKQVVFYGNGFGPIKKLYNRKLVKYIINQVDVITVRDIQSKELMRSLGIQKEIYVTADVAFAMDPVADQVGANILTAEGVEIDQRKLIGISVRPWSGEKNYREILAKTADHLYQLNYQVVFIPMQYPHDQQLSHEIVKMMKHPANVINHQYTPAETLSVIGQMKLLIGMRLHSLVFAAIAKIPLVGIEYDDKIKSFLEMVHQKSGGIAEALEEISLWATIEGVLSQEKKYQEALCKATTELTKKANMTKIIVQDFLIRG